MANDVAKLNRRSFLLGALATTIFPLTLPVAAQTTFEPFSFAFVSDIHLSHGIADTHLLTNESQLFLQETIRRLNQQKLNFVLFGGDQVEGLGKDEENWNLFLDIAQGLDAPWSFVLGEYDVSGPSAPADKMRAFGPDWHGRGIETTTPYWSQSPLPGVHIVGLDTSYTGTTAGRIDQAQLNWLKADLAQNKEKFTIVVSHHPILPPPPFNSNQDRLMDFLLFNGQEVRDVITQAGNVSLCLSAHLYVNQLVQDGNVWYVSNPGLVAYPCAYKIFHVNSSAIIMETEQIPFPALVKKAQESYTSCPELNRLVLPKRTSLLSYAKGSDVCWSSSLPLGVKQQASKKRKKEKDAHG